MDHSALRREIKNRLERGEKPEEIKEKMISNNYPADVINKLVTELSEKDINERKEAEKEISDIDETRSEKESHIVKEKRKEANKEKEKEIEQNREKDEETSTEGISKDKKNVHDARENGVSIKRALKYPITQDIVKFYILGAALMFSAAFLIPIIFIYGYFLKTIDNYSKGRRPPKIGDFGELGILGLKQIFVYIVFGILVASFSIIHEYAGAISTLAVLIIAPAINYVLATEKTLKSALNLKKIFKKVFSLKYLIGSIKLFFTSILLFILLMISMVTMIGPLAVNFYNGIVFSSLIAQMCSEDK